MTTLRKTVAVGLWLTAMAAPAEAQMQALCASRESLLSKLSQEYREVPVGAGLAASRGEIVELLVSADGTWTVIVTGPRGLSCMVAFGENWEWRASTMPAPGT